ncbi:B12-binding domain-containing radical SAM protein [Thermodesulfobacteriota bacterium]
MNVLLINPTIRKRVPPYNFPVGLGIIAAIMRKDGYNVHVFDQNALRVSNEEVINNAKKIKNIDIIGIGGLITTYGHIKGIVSGLREAFPKSKIVLGGGVTVEPSVVFENMPVDFCVHGEGEHTFKEVCSAISNDNNDFSDILGISYLKNNKIVTTDPRPIETNLDLFPMPAYDMFPSEIYFKNNVIKNVMRLDCNNQRCATLLWSRGCPHKCTFCWRMMGKTLRFRTIDAVMKEIRYLREKYDVDSYLFVDECINAIPKLSLKFANTIVEEGFAAPWYSHARVTNFNQDLAKAFTLSGCKGLNFGIESGSPQILKTMNKKATPEQAEKAIAIAEQFKIKPVCTFIIGMPGETKETVKASVDFIIKNRIKHSPIFFATPYPGCELYKDPFVQERIFKKYGSKDQFFTALGDARAFCVNLTDFTDSELLQIKKWIDLKLMPMRFVQFLGQPKRWVLIIQRYHRKVIKKIRKLRLKFSI